MGSLRIRSEGSVNRETRVRIRLRTQKYGLLDACQQSAAPNIRHGWATIYATRLHLAATSVARYVKITRLIFAGVGGDEVTDVLWDDFGREVVILNLGVLWWGHYKRVSQFGWNHAYFLVVALLSKVQLHHRRRLDRRRDRTHTPALDLHFLQVGCSIAIQGAFGCG